MPKITKVIRINEYKFILFSNDSSAMLPNRQIKQPIRKNLTDLETTLATMKIKKLIPKKPLVSVTILKGIGVKPPMKT